MAMRESGYFVVNDKTRSDTKTKWLIQINFCIFVAGGRLTEARQTQHCWFGRMTGEIITGSQYMQY